MPRKKHMSWEGKPNYRWVKMVKGVRVVVKATDLGFEGDDRTEANTLDAANAWWEARQQEQENPAFLKPFRDKIDKLKRVIAKVGLPSGDCVPEEVNSIRWQLSQNLDSIPDDTPTGQTVKFWMDTYLKSKLIRTERGFGRFDNIKRNVGKLAKHVGESSPVTMIDWKSWDSFTLGVKNGHLSPSTTRDLISDCRAFVRYLERRDIIPAVKNLPESARKKVTATAIEHFTKEELRFILDHAEGLLRTFILLFMNCGFRQSDVSSLTPEMLKIKPGYITRQRGKTEGTDAPIVSWKLWPETKIELEEWEFLAPSPTGLYLSRPNGKPWVVEGLNEKERRSRDDAFRRELWLPFAEKYNLRLSADAIRASCANLLKTDSDRTNQLSVQIKYLAQTPSGVALRHYIDPDQAELDSAVMGLRAMLLTPNPEKLETDRNVEM